LAGKDVPVSQSSCAPCGGSGNEGTDRQLSTLLKISDNPKAGRRSETGTYANNMIALEMRTLAVILLCE